ncbi:MAG: rod shape-determining protein MreC [Anaerovoracaceae bacterium]
MIASVVVIIIVLLTVVVVSYLSAGGASIVGNGLEKALITIQKPFSGATSGAKNASKGIFKYRSLQEENEKLKDKVFELEQQNIDLQIKKDEAEELKSLSEAFDFEPFKGGRSAVAGNIIAVNNSNIYDSFTIDCGTEKGIKKGDIVVDNKGLVGKITKTGKGYSKVTSILDYSSKLSFSVLRDSKIKGVINGNDKEKISGYLINEKYSIVKGDVLITSGVGSYPKGIKIGKVSKVDFDSDTQLKKITVSPTVHFDSMQKVAVFK